VHSTEVHGSQNELGVLVGDISGLRRPNNVRFATKVASSTRMMCTLRFLESFKIAAKFAKECEKWLKMPKKSALFSTCYCSNHK